ncbi:MULTISPECIES: TetR/AcrR family transcriptional regulator [Gordonia]|jgi:AcrR family transcriptional regulator|nr:MULTISPECIES: TetR/AcrR family transcriptional regulator [Gordonia]MBD0021603.1 TetR/AcrR family transcriptional regulator [Gordonia sp. (in: high G+C Gram-positive bacteria)]
MAARRAKAAAVEDEAPRTRGGWTPVGTAAGRREVHNSRGTARGERTRRQIIDAARVVFERDGYLSVGVGDIAREAGVAHGSFYTYFPSKIDVFRIVCDEVAGAVDGSVRGDIPQPGGLDPVEALRASNIRYIDAYRKNARIYAMLYQLGHIDEELNRTAAARREANFARVAEQIRRWQARGVADPEVEPESTAVILVLAIANLCNWMFDPIHEEASVDIPQFADTVNDVWIKALDLRRRPSRKWLAAISVQE